jgi:putative membrane protein
MQNAEYTDIEKTSLTNTDMLAIGRNKLANERTFLAYIRTFLSFILAGVSLIQFFDVKLFIILGYGLVSSGVIILIVGLMRYYTVQKHLNFLK